MKTIKNILSVLLLIATFFWVISIENSKPIYDNTVVTDIDNGIQDIDGFLNLRNNYYKEIKVREKGGNNKGQRITEYLAVTNLDNEAQIKRTGSGYPWCAAFVASMLENSHMGGPRSAWSPTMATYNVIYSSKNPFHTFPVKPNNLVFGLYYKKLGRIGHTGFIDEIHEDYVITIEGNTGPDGERDGDGVHRKKRPKRSMYKISEYKLKS